MMAKANGFRDEQSGEALERSRRRRKLLLLGVLVGGGFAAGFLSGFTQADKLFDPAQKWPPALGLGLAAAYLLAAFGGGYLYSRQIDEFERMGQYKAVALGAGAYALVYPVWLLLWKSGLVPEPMHFLIYVLFMVTILGASLFYRVR